MKCPSLTVSKIDCVKSLSRWFWHGEAQKLLVYRAYRIIDVKIGQHYRRVEGEGIGGEGVQCWLHPSPPGSNNSSHRFLPRPAVVPGPAWVSSSELETNLCEVWSFTITENFPSRAFCWLKVPTSTFTFKTQLLRQYAKITGDGLVA